MIPEKELGWEKEIGSIAPGKLADIIVWDEELNRKTGLLLENDTGEHNKDINGAHQSHMALHMVCATLRRQGGKPI